MASREHILLEPYCIFCRSTALHLASKRSCPAPWETHVYCFFEIDPDERRGHRRGRIFRMSSRKRYSFQLDPDLYTEVYNAGRLLCYNSFDGRCSLNHTANLAHISCLQLAVSKFPDLTISSLCQISKVMQPLIAWDKAKAVFAIEPTLVALPVLNTRATGLSNLLMDLENRLPPEILMMICTEISDGLFASLARCHSTLRWLVTSDLSICENTHIAPLCTKPLLSCGRISGIKASMINIMGESCLARLGADDSFSSCHEIPISTRNITGVQLGIGPYAVQGLRICYRDGSASPWLGEPANRWRKFVPGTDLQRLQVKSDGVKIIAVAFDGGEVTEGEPPSNTIWPIWDRQVTFSAGAKCSMIDLKADRNIAIRGHSKSRFARYLDLNLEREEGHTLTAFCSASGICCIQVDGDSQRKLGEPRSGWCPITFYLSPNEQITSLHIVFRQSTELPLAQGPFLAAQTSSGRTLYYGAVLIPSVPFTQGYFARFNDEGSNSVAGIFSDSMTCLAAHKTLGVVWETTEISQNIQKASPSFLRVPALDQFEPDQFLSKHREHAFLSKADLSGTNRLKMQKIGDRCVGLLAILNDSSIVTLGQWNPSDLGSISTIYDESEGLLKTITFVFSAGPEHERYVQHVIPNNASIYESHFHWGVLEEPILWLFTNRYDYCAYWKGIEMKVPVTASDLPLTKVAL